MKRETNFLAGLLAIGFAGVLAGAAHACGLGIDWSPTVAAALADAGKTGRLTVVAFTGSDWSARTLKLDEEVLMNPEFGERFTRYFALALADFPQRKAPDPAVLAEATEVATRHKIRHWPTLLALRPDGSEFARFEYHGQSVGEVTTLIDTWHVDFSRDAKTLGGLSRR